MGVIGIVLIVILVISAILLVLVVLIQDDQGEGIGGIFGGGSNSAFGSRSGNILTRFTAVLATIFLVSCFALAWLNRTPAEGNLVNKARQQALNGSGQQSWWVQTPSQTPAAATPAPAGAALPSSAAVPAPATSPAPAPQTPAQGGN
jgi:preprotein translocase subunit SecG